MLQSTKLKEKLRKIIFHFSHCVIVVFREIYRLLGSLRKVNEIQVKITLGKDYTHKYRG